MTLNTNLGRKSSVRHALEALATTQEHDKTSKHKAFQQVTAVVMVVKAGFRELERRKQA